MYTSIEMNRLLYCWVEKSKILYMGLVRKGSQVQFTNENFRPLHSNIAYSGTPALWRKAMEM